MDAHFHSNAYHFFGVSSDCSATVDTDGLHLVWVQHCGTFEERDVRIDRNGACWLACLCLSVLPVCNLHAADPLFRVDGYLPDYRAAAVTVEMAELLTDLTLFSVEVHADGSLHENRWTAKQWDASAVLRSRPGLRTHLCVGGWDRSAGFAAICESPAARQKLGRGLVEYCRQHSLSGVNLDWEHPSTAQEQQGYSLLLSELQPLFRAARRELSIAVAPSQKLPKEAWAAVDHVMLMSYDDAGKHSTFESCQKHLGMLLDQGVPASKIVLCLPLYGRKIATREAMTYAEIVRQYAPRPDQDEVDGIFFNGPGTIAAKTAWAQSVGLGGVAVWELGQDAPGEASLLKQIHRTVRQPQLAPIGEER